MSELLAIGLILGSALCLRAVIRAILKYFAVEPVDPGARSNGLGDVRDWLERRRSGR